MFKQIQVIANKGVKNYLPKEVDKKKQLKHLTTNKIQCFNGNCKINSNYTCHNKKTEQKNRNNIIINVHKENIMIEL